MTTRLGPFPVVARLGLIALVLTACGTAGSHPTPSGSSPTLMAGWEGKFTLEWQPEPEPGGAQRLRGYVVSRYGQRAEPMRVLGQAIDGSGGVVGQRIAWVPGGVAGFGRAYFEVPHLPPSANYRVTVWDYTIVEGFGGKVR